jgi:hypothetical protein
MLYKIDGLEVEANFSALMRERGKIVPGSRREVHNVFTNNGRSWLTDLVGWSALGDPDVAKTHRRVRWIGVGTGLTFTEDAETDRLEVAAKVNSSDYLAAIQTTEYPPEISPGTRFIKEFGTGEISIATNPVVPISEAGLFVDTLNLFGSADSAFPGLSTMLDPTDAANSPVAYARFEPVTKTQDFVLEVRWDFRF